VSQKVAAQIRLVALFNFVKLFKESFMSLLKDRIKNKTVKFSHYSQKELWYTTEDGFTFPVPIEDTGNGTFLAEDKAIYFMRYISRYMKSVEDARK
jgi:hypothetical protein